MPSYTIDINDNTVLGSSGDDALTGMTGGIDVIHLGAGADLAFIYLPVYFEIEFIDDPYGGGSDYIFDTVGEGFTGILDGGAGDDTLLVDLISIPEGVGDPRDFSLFSFRDVTLSGFEHLQFGSALEISVSQLNSFQSITHIPATSDDIALYLFGAGGAFDLSTQIISTTSNILVDGSNLTSALHLIGSNFDDSISDTPYNDEIYGGSGDDDIVHIGGADSLFGGGGIDSITFDWTSGAPLLLAQIAAGLALPDGTVIAGFERFYVTSGDADDRIYGTHETAGIDGLDAISGGAGNDTLYGLSGRDSLYGQADDDTLYGAQGDDYLIGGSGSDIVYGGAGNDYVASHDGPSEAHDLLYGGSGDDYISAGTTDDVFGGAGNDRVFARDERIEFGTTVIRGGTGDDNIRTGSFYIAYGNDGDDTLTASGSGGVQYYGGAGADVLIGAGGNDFLFGGRGDDVMRGGGGDDTYVVNQTGDVVVEGAAEGRDTVQVGFSYILGAEVENLVLTGDADANGWGNTADNTLWGNAGDNRLNGLSGADTMIGGQGDDTYIVDNPDDVIIELSGEGTDLVQSYGSVYLAAGVERLALLGSANANAVGTNSANYLTGNAGDNILTGGGGLDALTGGLGADTFRYLAISDSNATSGIDRITDFDFSKGDRVDLSSIDANVALAGNQAFDTPISAATEFTQAGEFRVSVAGSYFMVDFNIDGDANPEFSIRFQGVAPPEDSWFIL